MLGVSSRVSKQGAAAGGAAPLKWCACGAALLHCTCHSEGMLAAYVV